MPSNVYPQLAQLAVTYRRQGLTATAALVDEVDAQLAERFGPLQEWRISPHAVQPWLTEYVRTLQAHREYAERGNQYGQTDVAGALGIAIGVTWLVCALTEGVQLTPEIAQRLVGTARGAVEKSFERINGSRDGETGKARFCAQLDVQFRHRQFLKQQERERAEAEVIAARARLAALAQ